MHWEFALEKHKLNINKYRKVKKCDFKSNYKYNTSDWCLDGEVWADINDYKNSYQVSNFGRIRSRDRVCYGGRVRKGAIMHPNYKKGYLSILLRKDNKPKTFLIHRLVAEAFIPNNNNLPCINHLDENKSNNNVENLEWCSYKENSNYGTSPDWIREMKNKPVVCIETGEVFNSIKSATFYFNSEKSHIDSCCRGARKTAFGLHWKFYSDYTTNV